MEQTLAQTFIPSSHSISTPSQSTMTTTARKLNPKYAVDARFEVRDW